MSFERLPNRYRRGRSATATVAVWCCGAARRPRLVIGVSQALLKSLRWVMSMKVAVYVGSGEDAGKLRITPKDDPDALTLTQANAASRRAVIKLAPWTGIPEHRCRSRRVEYRIIGERAERKTLEITLPQWTEEARASPGPKSGSTPASGRRAGGRRVPIDAGRLRAVAAQKAVDEGKSSVEIIAALAAAAGLKPVSVRRILAGSVPTPPLKRVQDFARALGVAVEDLLTSAEPEKPAASGSPEDVLRARLKGRRFEDDPRAVAECARAGLGRVMA